MKNRDLHPAHMAMAELKNIKCKKLAIAVVKNMKKIEKELEIIESLLPKAPEKQDELNAKINELMGDDRFVEYVDGKKSIIEYKDEAGQVIRTVYKVDKEKIKDFNDAVQALYDSEEYKDTYAAILERNKALNEIFAEDVKIEWDMFDVKDIPEDIKIGELYSINFMVNYAE